MTKHEQIKLDEFDLQKLFLFSEIGEVNSGYTRYSAAMYFHKHGLLSLDLLEIYRRCCKWDNEDPVALARHEGIKPVLPHELEFSETA